LSGLPRRALLLLDAPPIIYCLEGHAQLAARFLPVLEAHSGDELRLAVSTLALAEVMVGPLRSGDEALALRHRSVMETWRVVDLSPDIAESAVRLRATLGLKLPDAVQAASALAINADALVTHDRDFSRVTALRVIA
jgi:predicted nucleic acid-binding protein